MILICHHANSALSFAFCLDHTMHKKILFRFLHDFPITFYMVLIFSERNAFKIINFQYTKPLTNCHNYIYRAQSWYCTNK